MSCAQLRLLAAILLPFVLAIREAQTQGLTVSVIGDVQVRYLNISITGHHLNVSSSSEQLNATYRFLGVPYAVPLTSASRFAPAQPLDPSVPQDVNATLPAPQCPGANGAASSTAEDCLYLSIRTPDLGNSSPVLVLLSGTAFAASDGDVFVATQRVVMVTVASREGVLGYLTAGSLASNVGLLDQRQALSFISASIPSFGGDPSRVTLGGHGAAAAVVGLHAVAEGSKRLFHRIAMLGGSIASPLAWSRSFAKSEELGQRFVERVGCDTNGTDGLECLRGRDVSHLLNESRETDYSGIFVPVGAGEFFNTSESADTLWSGGAFSGQVLVGAASESGSSYVDEALDGTAGWDSVDEVVYNRIVSRQFSSFPKLPGNSTDAGRSLLRISLTDWPGRKFAAAVRPLLSQAIGDFRFICPVWEAASDLARSGRGGPVFVYRLGEGTHLDDARLFLGRPLLESGEKDSESQRSLSRTMMAHLAAFVTHGAPTADWMPFTPSGMQFMSYNISGSSSPQLGGFGVEPGRCPLWKHEMPFLNRISDVTAADSADEAANAAESNDVTSEGAAGSPYLLHQPAPTAAKILSLFPVKIIGFGQVTGYTIETDSHVVMSQFLGIPYAQPPMGDLRFSRPKSRVTNSSKSSQESV